MTHYHLYIECGNVIDDTSRFYRVGVGQSKQGTRDYLYLVAYAVQHGHYFHLWDNPTDDFYRHIRNTAENFNADFLVIPARQLVRHLKANTRPSESTNTLINRARQQRALNVAYRVTGKIEAIRRERDNTNNSDK